MQNATQAFTLAQGFLSHTFSIEIEYEHEHLHSVSTTHALDNQFFEKLLTKKQTSQNHKLQTKSQNQKTSHDAFAKHVFIQLGEYFMGQRTTFDMPLKPLGTPFQLSVWKALTQIPYGQTCSYKDIAIVIGNEKACRAVGMANNKNPIGIIVPCHRVIGANGKLVGYASGLPMKSALLDLEKHVSLNTI